MEAFIPKRTKKDGPERIIQDKIKDKLTLLGWFIVETHGNLFQFGLPDLFACHRRYGTRWIEVKNSKNYCFTPGQLDIFPKLCAYGSDVWILTSDDDSEIEKLFKPGNWYQYLKW